MKLQYQAGALAVAIAIYSEFSRCSLEILDEILLFCVHPWKQLITNACTTKSDAMMVVTGPGPSMGQMQSCCHDGMGHDTTTVLSVGLKLDVSSVHDSLKHHSCRTQRLPAWWERCRMSVATSRWVQECGWECDCKPEEEEEAVEIPCCCRMPLLVGSCVYSWKCAQEAG